jgi:hypothetical protein
MIIARGICIGLATPRSQEGRGLRVDAAERNVGPARPRCDARTPSSNGTGAHAQHRTKGVHDDEAGGDGFDLTHDALEDRREARSTSSLSELKRIMPFTFAGSKKLYCCWYRSILSGGSPTIVK